MKSWFLVGGYSKELTEAKMKKVKLTSKNRNTKRDKSLKVIPFVMTYHSKFNMDKDFKKVFTPKPMFSF